MLFINFKQSSMIRSPWSDKKVSGRAGHNSVALPTAKGWPFHVTMPCPALQGDLTSLLLKNLKNQLLRLFAPSAVPPGGFFTPPHQRRLICLHLWNEGLHGGT